MVRADIATRSLHDHRRSVAAWGLGVVSYVGMIVVFWPSIRSSRQLTSAFEDYPEALKKLFGGAASFDFASGPSFLNVELFSLMLPLLLSVFAIGYAASTLAGEEEHGALDLLLAYPVARRRIATEKALAVVAAVVVLTLLAAAAILLIGAAVGLDASVGNIAAACVGSGLVALVIGMLAFLAGAWRGSRAVAMGVGAAGFGAAYLVQVLVGFVDALEPIRWASPLYLANGTVPARNGWPIAEYGLLVGVAVGLALGSVAAFVRRDIGR